MPARIDATHSAFKRRRKIGPGPKKRPPIFEVGKWACERPTKKSSKYYLQLCKNLETGTVRTFKLKKKTKKRYNALYRAWIKKKGSATGPARPGYKCRKTRISPCR
jgi:hypothetical protein